jgi:hypothetical protein
MPSGDPLPAARPGAGHYVRAVRYRPGRGRRHRRLDAAGASSACVIGHYWNHHLAAQQRQISGDTGCRTLVSLTDWRERRSGKCLCYYDSPTWRRCGYSAGSLCSPAPTTPRIPRSCCWPSGRRAAAAGQEPEAVLGRPGAAVCSGPAAARCTAPPAPPDRLPADPAALARQPGPAPLDLPAQGTWAATDRADGTCAGAGDGTGHPWHPQGPRPGRPGAIRPAGAAGCAVTGLR